MQSGLAIRQKLVSTKWFFIGRPFLIEGVLTICAWSIGTIESFYVHSYYCGVCYCEFQLHIIKRVTYFE